MTKSKKTYNIKTLGEIGRDLNSFKFELEDWENDPNFKFDRTEILKKINNLKIRNCDKSFITKIINGEVKFKRGKQKHYIWKDNINVVHEFSKLEAQYSEQPKIQYEESPYNKAVGDIANIYGVSERVVEDVISQDKELLKKQRTKARRLVFVEKVEKYVLELTGSNPSFQVGHYGEDFVRELQRLIDEGNSQLKKMIDNYQDPPN